MRTSRRTAFIVTCSLATFAMTIWTASAQPAPDAAPAAAAPADHADMLARLQAMDTDHDGKWSKAEWLAGGRKERGFDMMDADHDGYLTMDELKAGMTRMRAMRDAKPN